MPNHVETNLTVTGDRKQLDEFWEKHLIMKPDEYEGERIHFDFQTIKPMPEELVDTVSPSPKTIKDAKNSHLFEYKDESDEFKAKIIEKRVNQVKNRAEYIKKFGADNWYDWSVNEWGTKWGAYDCNANDLGDQIQVAYNTAWSPATPILIKLSEMYPDLTFEQTILDEGMFFGGRQTFTNGEYYEELLDGDDLMEFCNAEFGYNYDKCKECGEWYNAEWLDEDADLDLCENCNMEKEGEEEK